MPGLYIHIPFCAHACPYCDFSFELLRGGRAQSFLHALFVELDHHAAVWQDTVFDTVFFGGGTPTCLTTTDLVRVFERLHARVRIAGDAEVTVEANPETVTDEKLAALRAQAVNRISLGVQSFQTHSLRRLGRHHSAARAIRAVEQIRNAGFSNLNIDLMFGAPEQSMDDWMDSLDTAVEIGPEHLSIYGLTIEAGTPFGRLAEAGRLPLPPEETALAMYDAAIDRLAGRGYRHYEVSNFAHPGAECRHNLTYWTGGDYLGLGPSAHSHIAGRRFANARDLGTYLQLVETRGHAVETDERLDREQRINEAILLGLRMIDGLDVRAFVARFGVAAYDARLPAIAVMRDAGLVEQTPGRLRLTRRGLAVADTVCMELMEHRKHACSEKYA